MVLLAFHFQLALEMYVASKQCYYELVNGAEVGALLIVMMNKKVLYPVGM